MDFKRITSPSGPLFEAAFGLYEASFPVYEQRPRPAQEAVLVEQEYHFEAILDEGRFVGLLFCWETAEFIYIEHFAISPSLRGKGCGSKALELLKKKGKPLILEIDPPVDVVSVNRRRFYENLGFVAHDFGHIHPPYRNRCKGHNLVIMAYPVIGVNTYDSFFSYLCHTVMADSPS